MRSGAAPARAAARPGGSVYCACHTKGSRSPAAPTRAAARPGGSVYRACDTKGSRGQAAPTRVAARPGGSVYCAWPSGAHARRRQLRPSGAHARRSSTGRLCVLRLHATRKAAAAQRRPRAPQLERASLRDQGRPCVSSGPWGS